MTSLIARSLPAGYDFDVWGNVTHKFGWGGEVQGGGAGQSSDIYYSYTGNRRNGFSYDAAGNLTNDLGQTFTYDATGQQSTAAYGGYSLQQSYDGDGLRVKKNDNGVDTYYLRSSVLGGQVVAEMNASGVVARTYTYLGGQLLALRNPNEKGSGVYWIHEDPITKSKRVTNSLGTVVSTIEMDPWGADTNRSSNAAFQPKKFTSYERDANGTDEAMFRRYNRWQSRFDQPDPYDGSYDAADPQSFNRYAYVQNDPVNFADPTGLRYEMTMGPSFLNNPSLFSSFSFTVYGWAPAFTATLQLSPNASISNTFPAYSYSNTYVGGWGLGGAGGGGVGGGEGGLGHEVGQHIAVHPQQQNCGVNPITGTAGFSRDPRGVPGNLRPGVGGQGYFGAARRHDRRGHQGLDISGVSGQSPVYANGAGRIQTIGYAGHLAGNRITIDQGNGVVTLYGHLDSFAAGLQVGSQVASGQEIGIVGQTGNAAGQPLTEAHVHFGVSFNGANQDPEQFLNGGIPCAPPPPR